MMFLICFLLEAVIAGKESSKASATNKSKDFDEKQMEREYFTSVQEDIHLADMDKNNAEILKSESNKALALSQQDVANGEIGKKNAEKSESMARKGTKPVLGGTIDLTKADAKFHAEDLQSAQENHETAKKDVEVVGKVDIQNSKEDKKNAQDFMKSMRNFEKNMP